MSVKGYQGRVPRRPAYTRETRMDGKSKGKAGLHCVPRLYDDQELWSVCGIPQRRLGTDTSNPSVRIADHHSRVSCRACVKILDAAMILASKLQVTPSDVLLTMYPPDVLGVARQRGGGPLV